MIHPMIDIALLCACVYLAGGWWKARVTRRDLDEIAAKYSPERTSR